MRMDYYQVAVSSGADFAAQMARTVEALMKEVESSEYVEATKEYQMAMVQKVVKIAVKGEAARSVKAQEEGSESAAGRS